MKKTLLIGVAAAALIAGGVALAHGPHRGGDGYGRGHGEHGYHHRGYGDHKAHHRGDRQARRARRMAERFDRLDANDDGLVTAEEIAEARAARFAAMDANADGSVTPEEWALQRMRERGERRIRRLDQNGDGLLQESEMPTGARLLNRFDLNADGAVSRAEIRLARQQMRGERRGGRHGGRRGGDWDRGDRWDDEAPAPTAPDAPVEPGPAE